MADITELKLTDVEDIKDILTLEFTEDVENRKKPEKQKLKLFDYDRL